VTISGDEAPYFRNAEIAPKKTWLEYRSVYYEKKKEAIDAEIAKLQMNKREIDVEKRQIFSQIWHDVAAA